MKTRVEKRSIHIACIIHTCKDGRVWQTTVTCNDEKDLESQIAFYSACMNEAERNGGTWGVA